MRGKPKKLNVPKGIVAIMKDKDYVMIVDEGCCSRCGDINLIEVDNFPYLKKCKNCYLLNLNNFKPPTKFDFRVKEDDGREYFYIAGLRVPADILDKYLTLRLSSCYARVQAHLEVLKSVNMVFVRDQETREKRRKENTAISLKINNIEKILKERGFYKGI